MEKKNEKTKIYNVIIMDKSGSMWDIQRPAIQGYNEILGSVKAAVTKFADTQQQFITLVLFDSTSIDEVYWNADPTRAEILTDKTYVPGACTPLYDAMGRTLTKLKKELAKEDNYSVAVTVITDGLENSSTEYGHTAIKRLVERLKQEGWSFAYMGTDHDVHGVSVSLSITNVIQFEKTEEDTRRIFEQERNARERYWAKMDGCHFSAMAPDERRRFRTLLADEYYDAPDEPEKS